MSYHLQIPQAVLFDLDGTIIDSENAYSRIWNEIESCFPTGVANFHKVIKGRTLPKILNDFFAEENHAEIIRMLYEKESRMVYDYCEGAQDILAELESRGIPMALVTSSDNKKMSHLWAQHPELKSYFQCIVDSTMVTRSKPDPQGYLLAAEKIGADPRKCVVMEDAIQGIRAGKSAGAFVVGMSATLGREAIASEADLTLDSLYEFDIEQISRLIAAR